MIKIDSFIVNKGSNSSSSNGGGGFANTVTVQKKLETHKLWGQEFDGTQDVDGDMTVNGNINVSGNVKATKGEIAIIDSTTINNSGNIVNGGNLKTTNATVDNDLTVTNNINSTTINNSGNIVNGGNLKTTNATVNNDLTVTNNINSTTINNSGNLKTTNATVNNDLTVTNNANITTINSTTGNITTIKSTNITNSDTIRTKNLQVTGTAHFFNLIIDKIKAAGGAAIFTPADGFDVDIVQDSQNEVKLLWQCQDEDGNQRDNMWKANDQALCMSFNKAKVGTTHNVSNKYYWALVTSVNNVNEPTVIDGVKYNYITLSKTVVDGVLNPEVGDSIVMCGYRGTDDDARQSAIYISAYSSLDEGLTAPLFAQYQGINDFNLESHRKSYFDANRAKFVGEFEATDGQNIIDIINNKITDSEASIKLDTKNIVLSVSEKIQERRNLLVGSDFKRKINNFIISNDARIEMNSGYNGTNCIKIIDDTDGTSHYIGVYWDGSQGGRSVKIEKGKKYTISCYCMTNDSNTKFSLEAIYTNKETNAQRLGRPKFLSPNFFNPKYNQWQLFTTVIDTTDAESDYIAFNFWEYCNVNAGRINAYICRPMVEEGDTYYGWTLSDEDSDYVGANLIDNSRTFQVGGNTLEAIGTKTLKGDVYELTYRGSAQYNTFYRIDSSNFKLDTDYTLSFDVRGDAKYIGVHAYYPMTKTPYTLLNEAMGKQMYEQSGDGNSEERTTLLTNDDIKKEKKLWVHFKFMKRLPRYIYFQFPNNSEQTGVTSWSVSITKPKIEEGANVTEWTEKKTDVEKSLTTITNNVSTLDQKADSISSRVSANTKSITTVTKTVSDNKAATDKAISDNKAATDKAIANTNNTITALTQTVKNNYSTLDQKADGIKATVSANTETITAQGTSISNLESGLTSTNNTITALTQTVKNNYSTLDQKADGIKATVSANTETITAQGTSISNLESGLTSTNSTITALTKTVKDNYSTLDHKADNISSTVSSHTQIIEGLDGRVTTNTENISKVKQTASSITSTVSSMKNDILGANCMLGLNGKGWSSNTIYEDAGNSFHCDSTDWFQSHPIMDFSGDYTFSFGLWNDNLQIKILDFTQTYYDAGIYDQYVDFGTYTPCKILTTQATVPNETLTNYANNGTASNWTYTNTETITLKVNDNVAVRVTNGDNKRYNSIYGTVSAINTSSKSVTVNAIALLDQPNVICTLTCPKDKKDGTDINSLHYDEKLNRYWIRFKETRGTAKTFVMLFRNLSTSSIAWISRLMLEESVEYPHRYNATGQASQSMIKQTAESILAQVNDTYIKIGDGNITLNGDTKVNGSLTLNDDKQGFLLLGNGGITEISPKSIGTYNEFASKTTNVIKTHYDSKIYGYKAEDGDYYRFSWTVLQRLGTFKKGTYIKILNYTNSAYAVGATSHISTPYATFYIYEGGTTTKTINLGNKTSVDIANYTVVGDNVDIIVDGHFTIGVPTSIWGAIDPHYKPAIDVSVNWNNEVPKTSSAFMLIGYDGWGISFGTNKTVYCGKEGFVAKYANNEFRITDAGISHNNMATTYTIIGSSSSSSPTTYTVQDPVDTILCKSGYCKVIFPSNPYNGQRIKIYDKSSAESYINSNGKYVCRCDRRYDDRSIWTNQNLPDMVVRIYTYINDTWFEEYTG